MVKKMILICLMFMISCEDSKHCCIIVESDILLKINDSQGNDLLDPNQGNIDHNTIKIFYTTEQIAMQEVNNPNLDSPKGYKFITPSMDNSSFYKVQLFLNSQYLNADKVSYTYIQWSSGDTDKIKAQFDKRNNNFIVSKIWINDQLKWVLNDEKIITIIK